MMPNKPKAPKKAKSKFPIGYYTEFLVGVAGFELAAT